MQGRADLKARIAPKDVAEKMLKGLKWLHSLRIIHRDIKPTNVLLMEKSSGELELKISDFGFAKEVKISSSQISVIPNESVYWEVPEMSKGRYNMKSDVYSMGCLIYYIANAGITRKSNNLIDFSWSSSFRESSDNALIYHLVSVMTKTEPDLRPSTECLLYHPYLWNHQKILNFLVSFADRIKENDSLAYATKSVLQEHANVVIGSNWCARLEPTVISSLAYRSARHNYNEGSLSELLRALRNKEAHYDEMSQAAKQIYGTLPDGFTNYWTSKFPMLLITVYLVGQKSGLNQDPTFSQYYQQIIPCDNLRKFVKGQQ